MKTILFLIGGTGNQLFQLYESINENFAVSDFFIRNSTRKIFKHTNHENLSLKRKIITYPLINLFSLLIDTLLSKTLKISLFSDFDTKSIKLKPKLRTYNKIGYYQKDSEKINDTKKLAKISQELNFKDFGNNLTVIHIRGGDFLSEINENFGNLKKQYYCKAIEKAFNTNTVCHTNDRNHAEKTIAMIDSNKGIEIKTSGLSQMINESLGASLFIASNSSLSWWIAMIRLSQNKRSIVPHPFNKKSTLTLPENPLLEEIDASFN